MMQNSCDGCSFDRMQKEDVEYVAWEKVNDLEMRAEVGGYVVVTDSGCVVVGQS